MGRILIFSEFYYPKLVSSGYFITEIAEHLAHKSEVTVICPSEQISIVTEKHNGVNIVRIPDIELNENNLLQRTFKFLKITQNFIKIGKKKLKSDDKVICLTNPAFSLVGISKLKREIGFNLTILVHDVFPENLIGSRIIIFKGLIYYFLLNLFNNSYKNSDKIIVIGRDMKEIFIKKLPDFKGDIIQIPNWGDPERIFPAIKEGEKILINLKITGTLTFQFSGNIGRAQGIKPIVEAAGQLKDYNINFLFFGDGTLKDYIKNQSKKNNKIVYGGTYSRENANDFLNACDVALVSLLPGMCGLGVPSKTYDIMAAGKPILFIGPADSEIGHLVIEEKIGWVVNSGLVQDIVITIKQIYKLESIRIEAMGKIARNVLLNKYSKKIILSQYERIFN